MGIEIFKPCRPGRYGRMPAPLASQTINWNLTLIPHSFPNKARTFAAFLRACKHQPSLALKHAEQMTGFTR